MLFCTSYSLERPSSTLHTKSELDTPMTDNPSTCQNSCILNEIQNNSYDTALEFEF